MTQEQENLPRITVSGVLNDLQNGLTRDDIGEKYGLNKSDVKDLFKHPKLKNKKTIKEKTPAFILVDDLEEDVPEETMDGGSVVQQENEPQLTVDEAFESSEEQEVEVKEQTGTWAQD